MKLHNYRAWHKRNKKMYHVSMLCPDLHMVMLQDGDTLFSSFEQEIELMDCLPFKSGSNQEIYEGDIIEIEGATAKVVFWGRPPTFGLNYYHNESAWCEDWNLTDDSNRMTVIGNIYEHPELLVGAH